MLCNATFSVKFNLFSLHENKRNFNLKYDKTIVTYHTFNILWVLKTKVANFIHDLVLCSKSSEFMIQEIKLQVFFFLYFMFEVIKIMRYKKNVIKIFIILSSLIIIIIV